MFDQHAEVHAGTRSLHRAVPFLPHRDSRVFIVSPKSWVRKVITSIQGHVGPAQWKGGDWAGFKNLKRKSAPVWVVSNEAGRPIGSATHCLVMCGGTDADGRTVSRTMESEHSVRSECDVAVAVPLGGRELR